MHSAKHNLTMVSLYSRLDFRAVQQCLGPRHAFFPTAAATSCTYLCPPLYPVSFLTT